MTRTSALLALVLFGCGGSAGPDDSAVDTGAPDSALDAGALDAARGRDAGPGRPTACGAATFAEGVGLRRRPYLQSTTTSSVRVAWTTVSPATGAATVRYATSPSGPWTEVAATSELFDRARTADVEFTAHDATLAGLQADTTYCYEVRAGEVTLARGLALHTAWEGAARPVRIVAMGDTGTGLVFQRNVRDRVLEREFDIFLHLGDLAYTDGTFREIELFYFRIYADFLHGVPSFPAIGNHEYDTALGQPYLDSFYLFEQALRPADQERYYSFDYGDAHFVALDTNPEMLGTVSAQAADDMIDWLRADLGRSTKTWKIAFFHHPPYSSSIGDDPDVLREVVPALEELGVDLVLAGHRHDYERFVPLYQGAPAPDDVRAITYIVSGNGGAPLDSFAPRAITAASDGERFGFVALELDGCTAHGEMITDDGTVADRFEVNGCER